MADQWEMCVIHDIDGKLRFYTHEGTRSYLKDEYVKEKICATAIFHSSLLESYWELNGKNYNDLRIPIFSNLLAEGWEPYSASDTSPGGSNFYFRRKFEG